MGVGDLRFQSKCASKDQIGALRKVREAMYAVACWQIFKTLYPEYLQDEPPIPN